MRVLQLNLAWRVTLVYAFFGGLWFLFSDRLLLTLVADPQRLVEIETVKDWGFVVASATLLYLLLRHELNQRLQTEKTLRESEQRFKEIVENAQAGYFFVDSEGYYRTVNQAWLTMHGYDSAAEVIGQPFSITQVETDLEQARVLGKQVLQGEPISSGEFSRRCKDGSIKFHTFSSRPVIKKGQVIGLEGFMTDITERKQAEEQIRFLSTIAEQTTDSIIVMGPDYRIIYTNEAAQRLFGYTMAELVGQKPDIFNAEAEVQNFQKRLYAEVASGNSYLGVYLNRRKDGSTFTCEFKVTPMWDADGRICAYIGVQRDITERKRAEQQMAASTAQLRALSQRLVEMQETERRSIARELHDEVGQVILAVKTNLETMQLVREPETLNERLAASVNIVSRALEQIRTLALNLRPSLLDDFGLMPTLEWYLERLAKDVPFKINFQTNLPDMRFPPDIETNCFRVTQAALTNIARHAQATQVEVTLRLMPDAQALELSVCDDGLGFDVPAALERARRGESLGLLGMQERIQLIGGQIAIESAPGRGTEIRVRVPIKADLTGTLRENLSGLLRTEP